MADPTQEQLRQAHDLIKAGQRQQAEGILRPIVQASPDNANAWWLLANAVRDPNEAREALQTVLRLRPDHESARKLLDKLNQRYPPPPPPEPEPETTFDFGASEQDDIWAAAAAPAAMPTAEAAPAADPFGGPTVSFGTPGRAPAPADDVFGAPAEPFGAPASAPADDVFGAPVRATTADMFGAPARTTSKPKSDSNRTLLIILAVIGVLALCVCVACVAVTVVLPSMGLAIFGEAISDVAATLEAEGFPLTLEAGGFTGGNGSTLPSEVIQRGGINYGESRQDALGSGGQHGWTFSGNAGDNIVVEVMARDTANPMDPVVELYGTDNRQIASDDDSGEGLNSRLVFTLPNQGTYTIVVRTFGFGSNGGQYEVRLNRR